MRIKPDDVKRSRYTGVSWRNGKWRARITVDGRTHSLGSFDKEQDAAIAYDSAQRRYRGTAAKRFNFAGLKVLASHLLRLDEPIWTSTDGRKTPVSLLATPHLLNIERRLRYKGAVMPDEGTQAQWYTVISDEMIRRGLEPLPAHANQELESAELQVYHRTTHGKMHHGYVLVDIDMVPKLQKYILVNDKMTSNEQRAPWAFIDQGKDGLAPYRPLTAIITGDYQHEIRHANRNYRDCTRRNLIIELEPGVYKPYIDNHRGRLGPQADVAIEHGAATTTAKDTESGFFFNGPRRRGSPERADIKPRFTES